MLYALLMGFRRVATPSTERDSNIHAGFVVQHGWPAFGEVVGQLAHEHIAHKTRDAPALLCLSEQPAEYLHRSDIVFTKLVSQNMQRNGRASLSKGGERVEATLADPLIQAGFHVALPRMPGGHWPLQEVKFIGSL